MAHDFPHALLVRLLELHPRQQAEFLRQACADNPELPEMIRKCEQTMASICLAPVESPPLPASDGECAAAFGLALDSPAAAGSASESIGPYKLLQKLGEGGFGVVWMAEQQAPMRRRVALKIIKSGMDTREVIARFEAERQALALMDHPHIARVFDAGETDAGRPYFVMELVRGVPITRYCDENRVPTDERLRLFISVCQAVQHAHQKGVIHRDLKPSNILVTLHDGVPMPKVIDFGIAKAIETQLTEKTLVTQFHAFLGTPAYTSPEQLEMSGLDVDTRSDIYSLGVLLYELLAGRPPFEPDELLKSGLEEMRRTIREVEPSRPSHLVRTLSEELRTTVARQRGTDAAQLALMLRGDLDWIVMRCLEKDRTRRYDAANTLAADVRHFLDDEPVSARPPSTSYRVRKFARRHRVGLSVSVAISIALLGSLAAVSTSLLRERAARAREAALRSTADANAVRAQTAAAKSAAVARFMTDMLSGVGPGVALGRDTALLRGILDVTAQRLDTELRDQPAVAADLRDTLGAVYFDLGQYATAEPLLREAVATRRAVSGNNTAETATSLHHLGSVLQRLNNSAEAETALQEAVAIRRKLFGNDHPVVADTLYELTFVPHPRRGTSDMQIMMEEVLAIRRKAFGEEHASVARAIAGLGSVAQRDLNHEPAARLHTQALAMRRRLLGNAHPDVATSLDALGYSLAHLDRKGEAVAAYREAFSIRRQMLGDQHPRMVVSLLRFWGQMPARDADSESLDLVRGFVSSQRKVLPRGSALVAPSLLALASLLDLPDRDPAEAQRLVREAREILDDSRRSGAPLDGEIIGVMDFSAWSKFVTGYPAEARILSEEAFKLAGETFANDRSALVPPTRTLAWIYLGLRQFDDATQQFEKAMLLDRSALGDGHTFTHSDAAALGTCYTAMGRVADAHQFLERFLSAFDAKYENGSGPASIAYVLCEFGLTLVREGRFAEAEDVLRRAKARFDRKEIRPLGLRLRPPQRAISGLGQALAGQGKFAEAEPLVVQAFEELRANQRNIICDGPRTVREALDAVVAVYSAWGKPEKVAEWRAKLDEWASVGR